MLEKMDSVQFENGNCGSLLVNLLLKGMIQTVEEKAWELSTQKQRGTSGKI